MAEICSLHESGVTYEYEEVCEEESIFDNIGQTSLRHVWPFFLLGSFYLEIGWSVDMMITFLFGIFSLLSK